MAAVTHRVTTPDTGNTPNTSGAFTPGLGDLLVVMVTASATSQDTATLTSSVGTTFTQVNRTALSVATTPYSIYTFISDQLVTNVASQTITFDTASDPANGTVISVYSVSQMFRVGADALRQVAEQENQAGGGTPAPAFASACSTNNPTLGVVGNGSNPATLTPPTNWTEGSDSGYGSPTTGQEVISRDSGFTGTTVTWGSTSGTEFGSTIIELNADPQSKQVLPNYIHAKKSLGLADLTIAVNLLSTTLAPVTDPFYQTNWPNPLPNKPPAITWIQNRPQDYIDLSPHSNQELILRDFPGIRLTQINNLLQSTLAPEVLPTVPYDLSLPQVGRRNLVGFTFARPQFYEDSIQQNQYNWPNSRIIAKINPDWIFSQKLEEPTIPFLPVDQSNPKIGSRPVNDWIQSRPQYYIDEQPNNQFNWPNPLLKKRPTDTWINNNQENTLAPFVGDPFVPVRWPNPAPKFRLIVDSQSTPEFPTVGNPFTPIIYPNPIPKKIADNRTYINTLLPQNFKLVPVPVSFPNPIVKQYPIDNRTWINYPQLTRIVGDPPIATDQPNPRYKDRPVRDWTGNKPTYYVNPIQSSCPIMLGIGAPGDITCFTLTGLEDNPQPITTPTNNPTFETPVVAKPRAINWTQSRPFFYVDGYSSSLQSTNIPSIRKRESNKGFIQSRPIFYVEPAVEQVRFQFWQNPVVPRKGLIIESETRSGEPFVQGLPNRQRDWSNPVVRRKQGQDWKDYYIIDGNLPIQPRNIFNNINFTRKIITHTWTQSPALVATPISTPIGSRLENLPRFISKRTETWVNPSLSITDIPFSQLDFPNPKLIKYVTRWEWARPSYYEEPLPFAKNDYPNPIVRINLVRGWIKLPQLEEQQPIIPFDLSLPIIGRKGTESWIVNLLQSTLEPAVGNTPFAQNDYPNPTLIKKGKGWEWTGTIYYTAEFEPISKYDWPNPLIGRRNQVGFVHFIPISEEPRIVQIFNIPTRKVRDAISWIQNLQQSTLNPIPETSLAQKDWPNPLRASRNQVGFNYSIAHLVEGNIPFVFIESRIPKKGIVVSFHTYSSLIIATTPVGATPFVQKDWPVIKRIKFPDIYTINGVNYIILPQIKGRSICMLSAITDYDLLSALENYDFESEITIYDLDSGGTECE